MPSPRQKTVPLASLSRAQQKIVHDNLPLVHWAINKTPALRRAGKAGRSYVELLQEGALALVSAVRNHDPHAHGAFGAYALARIRFAMRRYAQENDSLIRVPYITQRRIADKARRRPRVCKRDRHRPDAPPRISRAIVNSAMLRRLAERRAPRRSAIPGLTLGDLARERLERAMRNALRELKHSPRAADDYQSMLKICMDERWQIPDDESQRPLRWIADQTGSSVGRITRCEKRYRAAVARRLEQDQVFHRLCRMARTRRHGWSHPTGDADLADLVGDAALAPPCEQG